MRYNRAAFIYIQCKVLKKRGLNMSKELTKESVIQNKKESIKTLNKMLEFFINDPTGKHLKKANLISYWIKDYVKMIGFEEAFDPTKNIAYKRGNIVKLNFHLKFFAYFTRFFGVFVTNVLLTVMIE